jgi:peptide/nickel transport system substrate-binding protein
VEWGVTSPKVPTQLLPFVSGPQPPKGRNFAAIDNDNYRELTAADAAGGPDCAKWNAAEMSLFGSTSIVPLDDIEVPVFTGNATFELGGIGGQILPTTLRVR